MSTPDPWAPVTESGRALLGIWGYQPGPGDKALLDYVLAIEIEAAAAERAAIRAAVEELPGQHINWYDANGQHDEHADAVRLLDGLVPPCTAGQGIAVTTDLARRERLAQDGELSANQQVDLIARLRRAEDGIAAMYAAYSRADPPPWHSVQGLLAELCDEHIDRSGALLARVREKARAALDARP